ncbi:unnamed protein product, partial [Polarella glacialis]
VLRDLLNDQLGFSLADASAGGGLGELAAAVQRLECKQGEDAARHRTAVEELMVLSSKVTQQEIALNDLAAQNSQLAGKLETAVDRLERRTKGLADAWSRIAGLTKASLRLGRGEDANAKGGSLRESDDNESEETEVEMAAGRSTTAKAKRSGKAQALNEESSSAAELLSLEQRHESLRQELQSWQAGLEQDLSGFRQVQIWMVDHRLGRRIDSLATLLKTIQPCSGCCSGHDCHGKSKKLEDEALTLQTQAHQLRGTASSDHPAAHKAGQARKPTAHDADAVDEDDSGVQTTRSRSLGCNPRLSVASAIAEARAVVRDCTDDCQSRQKYMLHSHADLLQEEVYWVLRIPEAGHDSSIECNQQC